MKYEIFFFPEKNAPGLYNTDYSRLDSVNVLYDFSAGQNSFSPTDRILPRVDQKRSALENQNRQKHGMHRTTPRSINDRRTSTRL